MNKSKSARQVEQQTKTRPDIGDKVIHRAGKPGTEQVIDRIYADNGVGVESGDFYRESQITYAGDNNWKANCGGDDGCCKPPSRNNRN